MKATPENKVKRRLKIFLDSIPYLFHYPAVAGIYSLGGIPDIVGCHRGRFFAIEVKAPGRRGEKHRGCSALQVQTMDRILDAGGMQMVFDGGDDDYEYLKNWIEQG